MSESIFDYIMRFIAGVVLGGILGSFLTMLTHRWPRGKSIVEPRSACPSCQKTIAWADMVPIYSYWRLKGKCRNCGKPFGQRYLMIETVSVAATTLTLLVYGLTGQGFMVVAIFAVLFTVYIILQEQGKRK